ncbi:MAG: hypothetical protein AAGF85_19515 [Bacteroidota bacterium]
MTNKLVPGFCTLLLILSFKVFCQSNGDKYAARINPISPTAYEFMKYGDIPVSEYTGIPNISIPIYTIKAAGLDIPISLSYHASGVRVAEEAGWTGLGWMLQTGGSITQVVNGMDDFGFYKSRFAIHPSIFSNPSIPNPLECENFYTAYDQFDHDQNPLVPAGYMTGYEDSEPDIFKFNVLQWSGEFILDWGNNNYVCLSDKNVQITAVPNSFGTPSEFIIKVPEGHTFRFKLKEETTIDLQFTQITHSSTSGLQNPGGPYMNGQKSSRTYLLEQITTNQHEVIMFSYIVSNSLVNFPAVSVSRKFNDQTIPSVGWDPNNVVRQTFPAVVEYTNYITTGQTVAYLNEITSDKVEVKFNSSSGRLDWAGTRKLDNIQVRTRDSHTVDQFMFNYDYFIGHQQGTNTDDYLADVSVTKSAQELTHRLKLLSIQKLGQPAYEFDYFAEQLPKKTSLATDYWGYYNGELSNASMYPNLFRFGLNYDIGAGNNKAARLPYAKAASLAQITYPTGGLTKFNYELHSFDNYFAPNFDSVGQEPNQQVRVEDNNYVSPYDPYEYVEIGDNGANLSGSVYLSIDGPCEQVSNSYMNTFAKISVYNEDALQIYQCCPTSISTVLLDPETYLIDEYIFQLTANGPDTEFFDFNFFQESAALVRLDVVLDHNCGPQNSTNERGLASIVADIDHIAVIPERVTSYGAGLRIKSIESRLNDSFTKAKQTFFEYEGGKLMSPLVYIDKYTTRGYWVYPWVGITLECASPSWLGKSISLNTSSVVPYSNSAAGSYVGYDIVARIPVDAASGFPTNGKVVTEFINNPDQGVSDYIGQGIFSSLPLTKSHPENGLVKRAVTYDIAGNKVQSTTNTWSFVDESCYYGLKMNFVETQWRGWSCNAVQKSIYKVGIYTIKQIESIQRSQATYQHSGSDSSGTRINYTYNGFNDVWKEDFLDSESKLHESYYYYPYDFNGVYDVMESENFITPVIRKESFVNSNPIQTERTNYFLPAGGPFLKRSVEVSKGSEPLEQVIYFDSYSSNKLLQYTSRNEVPVTYLWGYDGHYVVAEIVGATYAQASALVNQTLLNDPPSDIALRTELNKLRTGLPDALVNTYTHEPLVGLSSSTDPGGLTTYFEYDVHHRLDRIIDQDGHIIENYTYYYKN